MLSDQSIEIFALNSKFRGLQGFHKLFLADEALLLGKLGQQSISEDVFHGRLLYTYQI